MPNPTLTIETIVADMSEWLSDCFIDFNPSDHNAKGIIRGVSRHWDGSLSGFCLTMYGTRWSGEAMQIIREALA